MPEEEKTTPLTDSAKLVERQRVELVPATVAETCIGLCTAANAMATAGNYLVDSANKEGSTC